MSKKVNSKDIMLPHSQAKVTFYKTYLDLYLRVLCNAKYVREINIFDVFCGMGVYKDGGKGSPIEATNVINDVLASFPSNVSVNLYINDKSAKRVNSVRNYIQNNKGPVEYTTIYSSIEGEEYLEQLSHKLCSSNNNVRNLVFIDPYGYKEIKKVVIEKLVANGKTEVMIFLPISFMNRFTKHALEHDDDIMFQPLCKFVRSFFPVNHPIVTGIHMSHLDYISYLTKAFRFSGKYYTTSYHIERSANNFFALFFITSHIYGFEKILETKWRLDTDNGVGFELPKDATLFDDLYEEERKAAHFNKLEELTISFLQNGDKTNKELYQFALSKEYLSKHMSQVLSELNARGLIFIEGIQGSKPAKPGAFYISYREDERIIIKLTRK